MPYTVYVRAEYERRLMLRREAARQHERVFENISWYRLAAVVAAAVVAWWNFYWLPIPVILFIFLLIYHERIDRARKEELRAAAFYERALARLDHKWEGVGATGDRFREAEHPYAEDLDLFGDGSMFQLLSQARTSAGESTLAEWLRFPASRSQVEARQHAIRELAPKIDLREDLALLGEEVETGVHPNALIRWGEQQGRGFPSWARAAASILTGCFIVAFTGYMLQLWPFRPVLAVIVIQSVFALLLRDRAREVLAGANLPTHDLDILALVLQRWEREELQSPFLLELKGRLTTEGLTPSKQIARLHALVERNDQSRNQMFALPARLLLWSTHCALAIEAWRTKCGGAIGGWLRAAGELEAISSLAGYAAEHPDDVLPQLVDEGPLFAARMLGHPLLHEANTVRNTIELNRDQQLLVVSGSNMSGKSTTLRAVGLNAVLAWAGAPVRAEELRISPLAIGASIRVQDSLQDGKSRFYAEITRLRQIVDLADGEKPLLFLLDELLSGTNSHDRRIGAEALVRGLVRRGAIGLVTTHDLALTEIAEELSPRARNVHFEDHIQDGRIAFDYKMRPGVVAKSNALELMRSVGLEV